MSPLAISSAVSVNQDFLPDSLQMHGFLTQAVFHSSDNYIYGQSDDGVSPGLTEIGLNLSYQFISQLQGAVRYNVLFLAKNDKDGVMLASRGLPQHLTFAKDWMVSLRWDATDSWMLSVEYHRVEGTAWLPSADNPDRNSNQKYWDLYGLQLSYRF